MMNDGEFLDEARLRAMTGFITSGATADLQVTAARAEEVAQALFNARRAPPEHLRTPDRWPPPKSAPWEPEIGNLVRLKDTDGPFYRVIGKTYSLVPVAHSGTSDQCDLPLEEICLVDEKTLDTAAEDS